MGASARREGTDGPPGRIPAYATITCLCEPLKLDSARGTVALATRGLRQLGRVDATLYFGEWNDPSRHSTYFLDQRLDAITQAAPCFAAVLLVAGLASRLPAQTAPIIDTIVVINQNIFDDNDLQTLSYIARAANALHIKTQASVIRRTILFNQGEPYDSARAVESERALRGLNVFRQVRVDTVRVRNRLALRVQTEDGWSTRPQFNYSSYGGERDLGDGYAGGKPARHRHVAHRSLHEDARSKLGAVRIPQPPFHRATAQAGVDLPAALRRYDLGLEPGRPVLSDRRRGGRSGPAVTP